MSLLLLSLLACTGKHAAGDDTATDTGALPDGPWPSWAWEPWAWEDESTSTSVLEMIDGYQSHGIPLSAVIIDSPWENYYNDFDWETARFPDPQGTIDAIHDRDVRVMLWIVPAINTDAGPLYEEWANNGWFMQQTADGGPAVVSWWKGEGSLIDYWNPEALAAWHALMQPVLELGIDGWKCDGLDFSALMASYSPGLGRTVARNEYSAAYYGDFFDHTREVLGDDRIITSRPVDTYGADIGGDAVSFTPVDIAWASWTGDQDATFDGLRMALRNFYWSADAGYLAFGSDIGGYRDVDGEPLGRTKELFIRWAQVGALSPVMENGGGGEHWPWRFDDETVGIYKDLAQLHLSLLPWLRQRAVVAQAAGRSLMDFQDAQDYAYVLGDELFVAPILQEGGGVSVTFPQGTWRHLTGRPGQTWEGGTSQDMVFGLDEVPAFVKVGSSLDTLLGG